LPSYILRVQKTEWAVLAANAQYIAIPPRRDHPSAGAVFFEEDVRGDRGAMNAASHKLVYQNTYKTRILLLFRAQQYFLYTI
jgi:hypothetical protein